MELADFREQELVREVREQFHPMEEKSSFFSDQRDDPGIYRQGDGNLSA